VLILWWDESMKLTTCSLSRSWASCTCFWS